MRRGFGKIKILILYILIVPTKVVDIKINPLLDDI